MLSDVKQPGLYSAAHGSDILLKYFRQLLDGENGYHICVSHDVVLLPFIASLFDIPINSIPWPDFSQAVSLSKTESGLMLQYQSF